MTMLQHFISVMFTLFKLQFLPQMVISSFPFKPFYIGAYCILSLYFFQIPCYHVSPEKEANKTDIKSGDTTNMDLWSTFCPTNGLCIHFWLCARTNHSGGRGTRNETIFATLTFHTMTLLQTRPKWHCSNTIGIPHLKAIEFVLNNHF